MHPEWLNNIDIFGSVLAGLGLFFAGIRFLGDNLRQLANHQFRALIAKATRSDRSAAVLGFVGGAIMQSMNAVVFVLISLVTARVMELRRAHPVINFANLGSSVLVILAAFNPHLLFLLAVSLSGILFYADHHRPARTRQLIRALLGFGLLGLGLVMIKNSGSQLSSLSWMTGLLNASEQSLIVSFLMGAVVAVAVHSASSVTLVVMALSSSGIIDLDHSLLLVYGASIGSGISTLVLGAGLSGMARQLVLYQFTLKAMGLALLLPLACIEFLGHVPLVAAWLGSLPVRLNMQIAFAYLLYQVACDVMIHPLHHHVHHWLERLAPPTPAETLGKLQFIYPGAQQDPPSALVLTEQEQLRLLALLPAYLDTVREDAPVVTHQRLMLHQGASQITEACERFLESLLADSPTGEPLEQALTLRNRNQLLAALQETLNDLVAGVEQVQLKAAPGNEPRVLAENMVETLHLMLETLTDAARDSDADVIAMLQGLTGDRSELMLTIRRRLLAGSAMDSGVRETVFNTISLFERAVWLLRRYTILLLPRTEPGAAQAA